MPSNKRQRELARRRAERQAARRAAERSRRRKRRTLLGLSIGGVAAGIVLLLVLLSALKDDKKKDTVAEPKSTPTGACQVVVDKSENTGGKKPGSPPDPAFGTTKALKGDLELNAGKVELELFADRAPCASNTFRFLAAQKYFDGGICHRETATPTLSVLQCGDPTGTGGGGPGFSFKDENLPTAGADGSASYPRGTLAMANGGPNTNGSQFFIVIKDSKLGPNYTVFGKVTKGLEILDAIAAKGLKDDNGVGDGKPKEDVTVKTFRIT